MPKRQNMKENRELRKQHKQAERDAKKFAALAAKHLCAYKLARSREKAAVAAHERLSKKLFGALNASRTERPATRCVACWYRGHGWAGGPAHDYIEGRCDKA